MSGAPRSRTTFVCCFIAGMCGIEAEVMRLLAHGNNTSHIQSELNIGYNTVKYHVKNIYAKLDVHSQQELIDKLSDSQGLDEHDQA